MSPEKLTVGLGERSYDILLDFGLLDELGGTIRDRGIGEDLFLVSDRRVLELYGWGLVEALRESGFERVGVAGVPDGDENKNWEGYRYVMDELAAFESAPERRLLIVCLGGGMVGDLGGFVAATFRRGKPYVQVPTTLLACVDSGVGGKVAINWKAKNQVGAFWQPSLVVADLRTLDTLGQRQMSAGMGEVIKYGAILDAEFFGYLEEHAEDVLKREPEALMHACKRSYELKAQVVEEDERDTLDRRISLNFGHTLGHAVEFLPESRLQHGEAVAFGMACAADISVSTGLLSGEEAKRLVALLSRAGLPVELPEADVDAIMALMRQDKKFRAGSNRFVLLDALGRFVVREGIDEDLIRSVLEERMSG